MKINQVYEGDCLDVLQEFPNNCIDTIVTDPPYGLSFMGKNWDHGIPGAAYWHEALRVAKPGATLMAFGGTRTHHRLMCAIEDAGWEIRDVIMWVYGSGFPKSLDVSKAIDKANGREREIIGKKVDISSGKPMSIKQAKAGTDHNLHEGYDRPWRKDNQKAESMTYITAPSSPLAKTFDGYGTSLKPSYEPIIWAMKPLDGTYAENAEKWGIAGLWIDGGRIGAEQTVTKRNGNSGGNGAYGRDKRIFERVNPPGRWPANFIHDGSDEVMVGFDKAGISLSSARPNSENKLHPQNGNIYGKYNPTRFHSILNDKGGTPARFFYCAKASSSERGKGNSHPTVKPISLLCYLCKLTRTPYGGIVLDPFAGSGTTALAAISENRDYVLIEKESEYVEICKRRIAEYTGEEITPKEIKITEDNTVKQMGLW